MGTATLMRLPSQRQQLRVLDAALDLGVRYVDTAPLYGFGGAERLLGLRSSELRSAGVEVTTKVGLSAPRTLVRLNRFARPLRFALSKSAALTKAVRSGGDRLSLPTELRWEEMESSLLGSRRRLGVDQLDVVLLHERSADDLTDAFVRAWTRQMPFHARRSGVAAQGDWRPVTCRLGESVSVVQVADWTMFHATTGSLRRRVHGALRDVQRTASRLEAERGARDVLEDAAGAPLRTAGDIARAVVSLHGATGLVDQLVVGSTSTAHWQALVAAARSPVDLAAGEATRILAQLSTPGRPSDGPDR